MQIERIATKLLKPNKDNPRFISDSDFERLKQSIKEFPEMLEARPIIVDENMVVLGGNMRHKACVELKLKTVPTIIAKGLTEEQKKEFVIKDNANYGNWDLEELAKSFDLEKISEWGLEAWTGIEEADYSELLEDEEYSEETLNAENLKTRRVIQIPFESNEYEKAFELIKEFTEKGIYVGGILLDTLRKIK